MSDPNMNGPAMSGYLQRLVRTAAQPVQSVHPFAGSIFASSYDEKTRGVESEELVVAASAVPSSADPTSQPQNVPQHNMRTEAGPIFEYRPIAPVGPGTSLHSEGEAKALPSTEEQPDRSSRPAANIKANATERLLSPVALQTEFHPLMLQEAFVAEHGLTHAPSRAATRSLTDNRRPVAAERAQDDIQIHIGRIEVTAVHPPAPRPAKTPDRGPSLDAYLNRRAR
jgi:hypothetical protein